MSKRTLAFVLCVAAVMIAASSALGQTDDLTGLMVKTSFTAEDEARIVTAIKPLLARLVAGTDNRLVNGARSQLIVLTTDRRATVEFHALAARLIATQLQNLLTKPIVVHKNRLAVAIVVSRMQNSESVPLLLKLLVGEGTQGERYPSVRYWAAKGLAGKKVSAAILRNNPVPLRKVMASLEQALGREKDAICVGAMLKVAEVLGTDQAVDLLIKATAEKAKSLDLGETDAVDAMKQATAALEAAYQRDIRAMAQAKQPIVATLAQVLAQTPPHGGGLELITVVDQTLSRLTSETTGLGETVRKLQGQKGARTDSQTVDLVWVEQLNWIEFLLKLSKPENKDLRLKQRPEYLNWSPAKSAEVARKAGESE